MRTLYNILFLTFFTLAAPYYLFRLWRRGDWRRGFGQRFGRYGSKLKQALTNRNVLWLHAVSVGEANLAAQLVAALEARLPNVKLVVSTTTTTGMGRLRDQLPNHVEKIYYPVDRRKYVQRAHNIVHPEGVILVEAELWPNFLWQARRRGTPVFLVNARISDRSYRGYRRLGFLFRGLFAQLAGVCAQSERDARRLVELGCRPEAVHVVGSLKFDPPRPVAATRQVDVEKILRHLGVPAGAPVLVAGSTHDGEEAALADIHRRLKARHPGLFLVLVPRHHERARAVGRQLDRRGVRFVFRSEFSFSQDYASRPPDCLVVNSTGELRFFYEHASLVFVGKSLLGQGGQNPIEPAALGRPVLVGPNMQNFPDVLPKFLEAQALVQVPDAAALERALDDLLRDPARRTELGRCAAEVVAQNRGALDRTIELLVRELPRHDEEAFVPARPRAESA
jgi:3-deoxy-D-manno-octulosonic-acid transferase